VSRRSSDSLSAVGIGGGFFYRLFILPLPEISNVPRRRCGEGVALAAVAVSLVVGVMAD
jgi:hypothetical protein